MSVFQEKIGLFCKYCEETGAMPAAEAKDAAVAYIDSEYAKWENIWAEDGALAGFLVVLKHHGGRPPGADYMAIHLYVLPEYRRQGYAKKTLLRYLPGHPGKYCMAGTDGAQALLGRACREKGIKALPPAGDGMACFLVKGKKHEN